MEAMPNREAFERARDQVGFCGIWCGSCAVGNGCVGELGAGLRELLVAYDAPQFAAVGVGWEPFLEALGALRSAVACPGCHMGGGRDDCEIRICARRHKLDQCTECAFFGDARCERSTILEHMRSGAIRVGLSVLRPGENRCEALLGWIHEQAGRWPCRSLFAGEAAP